MTASPVTPPASQHSPSGSAKLADSRRVGEPDRPGEAPSSAPALDADLASVELLGMRLASCSEPELLQAVFGALARQRGGWLITANLDFLRRYYKEPRMQVLYAQADL